MVYEYECYQKEQLLKELLLLENHYITFKCLHCIEKHKLTVLGLSEETIKITPHEKEKELFREIIKIVEDPRIKINDLRDVRLRLTEITPKECGIKVSKSCKNKTCDLRV